VIEIPAGTRVYGVQLPIQAQSRLLAADWERDAGVEELARIARVADEHGYHYVGVCDHIALPEDYAARMSTYWQDCIGTLAWLAAITTRTNLLSHAYVLPYRHPLVAAKQFATLDHLSGGRAIVGIGAGHVEPEFERLGVDFHRRGRIVDERLPELIDALEHEWVDGYGASPRPVQRPRPPVWVAGSSPAAIERAARLADGWLPQGPSDDAMVARLRDARAAHGRADEPMMVGHIAPWIHVGTPSWDVPGDSIVGPGARVAEQVLDGTADGVNQVQVRFRARSCDELCDQMVAFASDVAPAITMV
jgi:probable F420-dependent oxidoreductase